MVKDMIQCEQTKGQSVYAHGRSVHDHLRQLIDFLEDRDTLATWKIPEWLVIHKKELRDRLLPLPLLRQYAIYHDCGKPYCKETRDGKVHFPDHAKVSYNTWLSVGGDKQVANLILHDMDIHTILAEDLDEFCKMPECITLLLVGLCEVHSNSRLFGGSESISFKAKWRQIDKRGRAICKRMELK